MEYKDITKKEIKMNIAMAEFMGLTKDGNWFRTGSREPLPLNTMTHSSTPSAHEEQLCYHESWDWLMPVIEKIEDLRLDKFPINVSIGDNGAHIAFNHSNPAGEHKDGELVIANTLNINYHEVNVDLHRTKLQGTYQAVFEFIEWYNKREKSEQ